MLLSLALFAAQATGGAGGGMLPASSAAIVAGAKACVGVTVDPAGQDARLAGWTSDAAGPNDHVGPGGRIVTRDNVKLMEKPGLDGGCVVQAKPDSAFDKTSFYAALSREIGLTIDPGGSQPYVTLPNGEVLIVQVIAEGGPLVQVIIGNPNGKHAKPAQGN